MRDAFLTYFGGISFSGTPVPLLLAKVTRVIARHPRAVVPFVGWLARTVRAVGARRLPAVRSLRRRHRDGAGVTATAITLTTLGKSFGDTVAVDDLSLGVAAG